MNSIWQVSYKDLPKTKLLLYATKEDACQDQVNLALDLLLQEFEDFDSDLLEMAKSFYALALENKFVEAIEMYTAYYNGYVIWELTEIVLQTPNSIPIFVEFK